MKNYRGIILLYCVACQIYATILAEKRDGGKEVCLKYRQVSEREEEPWIMR